PVLARRVGGLQEIVNDDCGLLCEPSELNPLTEEAIRLLSDETYYEKKSKAAFLRADEYDNCQEYVNRIYDIYCDLVKKTTVLHVLKSKIYSGAENVVCTIISNMPEDINSIYLTASGPVEDKLKELGIKYRAVPRVTAKDIKQSARDYNASIIHAHDFTASVLSAGLANRLPVISHIHNNPPWIKYVNLKTSVYALSVRRFKKVITVSSAVADEFIFKKELQNKVQVVGNPFDVNNVRAKGQDVSGIANPDSLKSDLLFVGRLTDAKQPLNFIRIVDEARKTKSDIRAIIVGDGELREDCENLISELGLRDTIEMVGFCGNPYPYISATRMIVMPSLWEGFGLVALEGMCFGKPILATKVGGLKEIVNEECGILCEPTDMKPLVAEALRLMNDEIYYESKSCAATKRADAYDNCATYVKGINDIYRDIMNNVS
ncbi:MAG: glycosyltransferase, partial [Bacteroidaceae bacterium]|nr:glycosyltransferase [Bacteroidaceae bacterium]